MNYITGHQKNANLVRLGLELGFEVSKTLL